MEHDTAHEDDSPTWRGRLRAFVRKVQSWSLEFWRTPYSHPVLCIYAACCGIVIGMMCVVFQRGP